MEKPCKLTDQRSIREHVVLNQPVLHYLAPQLQAHRLARLHVEVDRLLAPGPAASPPVVAVLGRRRRRRGGGRRRWRRNDALRATVRRRDDHRVARVVLKMKEKLRRITEMASASV